MAPTTLKFGIPDVDLRCASGRTVNPSSFVGHELVVLFGPLDPDAAEREIAAYRHHCEEFVDRDSWLLVFTEHEQSSSVDGQDRILRIPDLDRHAWVAFRDLTHHAEEMDRSSGATFLFTRGGGLHRYWHGAGHVDEVLAELRTPVYEGQRASAR